MAGLTAKLSDHLLPAERIMLGVTAALAAASALLVIARGYAVDVPGHLTVFGGGTALVALGFFYRLTARNDAIAATLIATGAYIYFAAVASAFNHALLPLWRAPIDPVLAAIDGAFGFHWPDALATAAQWPMLVEATRYAYMSSLIQFAIIVPLLGLSGRTRELQVFMLASVLCCLATVGFWALFPSLGTTSIYPLALEFERALAPHLGSAYGEDMWRLATTGPQLISPQDARGLISAPSFHTVMALLAIYATWSNAYARWPFLLVNALVLPGTIIHGAHHLIDVMLGAGLTVLGVLAAKKLLSRPQRRQRLDTQLSPVN